MKAIFCPRYGSPAVLESRSIDRPIPSETEILIQTVATSVTTGDTRVRALRMPKGFGLIGRLALGISKPRQQILGSELSGVVVSIGKSVTNFEVGDEVILYTGTKLGCHSEYKAVSQDAAMIKKPASMTFEEAAALAASGTTALAFLRKGEVKAGDKVLIIGAAGGVGSAAVMLAKQAGAEVTAVCSARNLEFVRSLGADLILDYIKDDFTQNGVTYDAILDAAGVLSYAQARTALEAKGRLLLVSASLPQILQAAFATIARGHRVVSGPAAWTRGDLEFLKTCVESGAYRVPVERTYPIEQIADAHAFVEAGGKRGNIVVSFARRP
ncbi:MAG: NAD(P)-dependent alcohol dehydrogenase [Methanoregulaceae archaeon]|nr:NAD(P)-dependent alcohol dehydrogenase [Methanoregulaceae archaeon]